MREYRRKGAQPERARLKLVRDADGRLRTSSDGDVGDIWAEQRRIKLALAIEADKRRAEKKAQRKAKMAGFFKRRPHTAKPVSKEFVVNIALPKLRVPKIKLLQTTLKRLGKKRLAVGVAVLAILGFSIVGSTFYSNREDSSNRPGKNGVLAGAAASKVPEYDTVLPLDKTIEELGGWARVSPVDKEPVFAYIDTIGDARITVSQQPLPKDFQKDIAASVKALAQQFGANEKLQVRENTAYVGTSIKGPQSVILSTHGLLILIKSDTKVTNERWERYIDSLN